MKDSEEKIKSRNCLDLYFHKQLVFLEKRPGELSLCDLSPENRFKSGKWQVVIRELSSLAVSAAHL